MPEKIVNSQVIRHLSKASSELNKIINEYHYFNLLDISIFDDTLFIPDTEYALGRCKTLMFIRSRLPKIIDLLPVW